MISIIIPVYNAKRYIRECLDSIKYQTYKELEVIIVDDGSDDNSEQIIRQYADCLKLVYFRQENHGVSAARNKGLELSSGEWVFFLDADDYLDSDTMRLMASTATEDCIVLGQVMNPADIKSKQEGKKKVVCSISADEMLDHQELYTVWNKLYPKKIIENSKVRFTTGLCYGEDILFNLKVLFVANEIKFCYLDRKTYFYRIEETHMLKSKFVDQYAMLINDFASFAEARNQNSDVIISRLFLMVINIICMEGVKNGYKKEQIVDNIKYLMERTHVDNLEILNHQEHRGNIKYRIESRLLRKEHFCFYLVMHKCVNCIESVRKKDNESEK